MRAVPAEGAATHEKRHGFQVGRWPGKTKGRTLDPHRDVAAQMGHQVADEDAAARSAACNLDAEQFAHALGCALVNAIEAAPEGSDITVRSVVTDDGIWVCVVHNQGPPVDPDTLARAFDPLVTTKQGHAGIGLAVAHRILTEHGGTVSLRTDGAGAALTLTLPAFNG